MSQQAISARSSEPKSAPKPERFRALCRVVYGSPRTTVVAGETCDGISDEDAAHLLDERAIELVKG